MSRTYLYTDAPTRLLPHLRAYIPATTPVPTRSCVWDKNNTVSEPTGHGDDVGTTTYKGTYNNHGVEPVEEKDEVQ